MQAPSENQLAIHTVIDTYEQAVEGLFQAIGTSDSLKSTGQQPTALDDAIDALIAQDSALYNALDEVHQHRRNSAIINQLQTQVDKLDAQLYDIMDAMQSAFLDLMRSRTQTAQQVPELHQTVPVDMLLQYANRIAKHTPGPKNTIDSDSGESGNKTNTRSLWPSEDMMRRGILATGSINMLKPSDQKRRLQMDMGLDPGPSGSQQQSTEQRVQLDNKEKDPTIRPAAYEDVVGQSSDMVPAASSAAALDLDLFDPDEDD